MNAQTQNTTIIHRGLNGRLQTRGRTLRHNRVTIAPPFDNDSLFIDVNVNTQLWLDRRLPPSAVHSLLGIPGLYCVWSFGADALNCHHHSVQTH